MYRAKKSKSALRSLTVCAFMAGIAGPAYAHHPAASLGTGTAGPITTRTAATLPRGKWSVSAQMHYLKLNDISDSRLEQAAAQGVEGVHGLDSILATQFGAAYGALDNVTVSVTLPVVRRTNIDEGHPEAPGIGEVEKLGDAAGLGDLAMLATWRVHDDRERPVSAALIAGLKMPTGDTHDRSDDGSTRFEAEFQPGSGSWDPLLGGAVTARAGSVTFAASILYQIATEGSQNTDLGDALSYDLAAAYRLMGGKHAHHDGTADRHPGLDLVLEVNGEWRAKEEMSGVRDPNSGGNAIFISPGLRFSHPAGGSAWVSVGVPITENRNGIQADVDLRLTAGIAQTF
ncbi:MAG: transporter [Rhodospirillales bacterium]|nr:transporter [Rhodospirillales bacterium]